MTDVLTPGQRSLCMSRIRGMNTKPEMLVRKALFADGFRYRLHVRSIPGKPDLVLPRYRACVFVNGCFWHGHECALFRWPATNREFWEKKISTNRANDARNVVALLAERWRILTIWECALKGRNRIALEEVLERTEHWLRSAKKQSEIHGREK
jgi:DNA mismatch endonuclease (patch repair protein)